MYLLVISKIRYKLFLVYGQFLCWLLLLLFLTVDKNGFWPLLEVVTDQCYELLLTILMIFLVS